jgi:hypothetical protein
MMSSPIISLITWFIVKEGGERQEGVAAMLGGRHVIGRLGHGGSLVRVGGLPKVTVKVKVTDLPKTCHSTVSMAK